LTKIMAVENKPSGNKISIRIQGTGRFGIAREPT
jgi:hypothetical protein